MVAIHFVEQWLISRFEIKFSSINNDIKDNSTFNIIQYNWIWIWNVLKYDNLNHNLHNLFDMKNYYINWKRIMSVASNNYEM